ncbi:MAG TPA: hypothetical protein VHC69_08930 [Polyangiaceae bacterium]|nr:hypothetical protein [Polyangiaceae bacterium]
MKTKLWPAAGLSLLLAANGAHAEAIRAGTFALGAERITGIFHADETVDPAPSQGYTDFALFGNNTERTIAGAWQLPRIGFDVFVTNGLSLGGSFVVLNQSKPDATDIIFAPRVGYAYMFGRVVGIWPRGGLSYWHASGADDYEAHSFAFDVDVPLLFACTHSFAITLGPLLDVGFAGKQNNADTSFVQFGLSAGIVGFL